ncbi:MAG: YHYH domain-containing protein [Steroidobacteraceae bacterium]
MIRRDARQAKRGVFRLVALAAIALPLDTLHAHPGGIDAHCCHKDSKTGQRHCHPERLNRGKLKTCSFENPPKVGDEGFSTVRSSES